LAHHNQTFTSINRLHRAGHVGTCNTLPCCRAERSRALWRVSSKPQERPGAPMGEKRLQVDLPPHQRNDPRIGQKLETGRPGELDDWRRPSLVHEGSRSAWTRPPKAFDSATANSKV